MKKKAALVITSLVFFSLISFSNKYGEQCDGRKMVVEPVSAPCIAKMAVAPDNHAFEREEAGTSPLLRMAIVL